MKLNKGFTLIELLAVIVILAIIALIATPVILNVIETAKQGAAKSSALGYIEAVEKHIMLSTVDTTNYPEIAEIALVATVGDLSAVKIKGTPPTPESTITIDTDGSVSAASLVIDGYTVAYDGEKVTSVSK